MMTVKDLAAQLSEHRKKLAAERSLQGELLPFTLCQQKLDQYICSDKDGSSERGRRHHRKSKKRRKEKKSHKDKKKREGSRRKKKEHHSESAEEVILV